MGAMAEPAQALLAGRNDPAILGDFGSWVALEQRRVFALCHRLLQDRDEADSAAQDVFLKAYQAINKKNAPPIQDPARWLTRIAINTCLDRLRSRKWQFWRRRPSPEDENAILRMAASSAPEAEDQYFARQIRMRLEIAMGRLSGRQRAVFTLRHYEDLSLEEIGGVLGLDVGTVKAHMSRAVAKLRKDLRDLYGATK